MLFTACGGSGSPGDAAADSAPDAAADSGIEDSAVEDTAVEDTSVEDSAAPVDAAADSFVFPDAGAACFRWQLIEVPVGELVVIDPAPLNPERSMRVRIQYTAGGCDTLAQPIVRFPPATTNVSITARTWRRVGAMCAEDARTVSRVVTFVPPMGRTAVHATPGGVEEAITVAAAPARACDPGLAACEMDCDCGAGEACLGGTGLGGTFTQCARPCEVDLDCAGGLCTGFDDGLDGICDDSSPGCDDTRPCPTGFTCDGGACAPAFVLNGSSRKECECDADCDPGLSCVRPTDPADPQRCEARCLTGTAGSSAVCQGPHVCGDAADDAAGVAVTDSVCVFVGE